MIFLWTPDVIGLTLNEFKTQRFVAMMPQAGRKRSVICSIIFSVKSHAVTRTFNDFFSLQ